ncbi:ATP-binding protein [Duganella sp. BuS-21]|uniref:ATP-binding protein n=1 Tax=Duganella sp. BuS-21 TaxID=2943848 RepID=UPI0035A6A01F
MARDLSSTQAGWPAAIAALDNVLGPAIQRQADLSSAASPPDPLRGMKLAPAEAARLLSAAMLDVAGVGEIAQRLALDNSDLAILLLVVAPDVDLRYGRLYGYIQDDLHCKRPRFELIAGLLAQDFAGRRALRARLLPDASLQRSGLLRAQGEDNTATWRIDDIWRAWLLDEAPPAQDGARMEAGAEDGALARLPHPAATLELLGHTLAGAREQGLALRLLLLGPHGSGKAAVVAALAGELGLRVLRLDLRESASPTALRLQIERAARTAALFGAVLMVHGFGKLEAREPQLLRCLADALAATACHLVLASTAGLPALHGRALPLLRVSLSYPEAAQRQALWRSALDHPADETAVAGVAERFALSAAQIAQAAEEAQLLARISGRKMLDGADLAAAARAQCGTELARLAQRIKPRADLDVLVTPPEVRDQLRELCDRAARRHIVGRDWADGSVHARCIGVKALFVGASGTGKTLSAEAVACALGLDLFRIDLAGIVSKYIGETEQNLDRVFAAAEYANAVLFFDEADALFGKRSEVKDAHDRYANTEVAYLLQKMEQFDGLAILATNLKQNLDEAFARRLTFTITFPFPEEAERLRLWEGLWPPKAPRGDDVDLAWFAREYRLSGGNIRNTVLAAAHLAAADGQVITRAHLLHATRREFQKLGKNLAPAPMGAAA